MPQPSRANPSSRFWAHVNKNGSCWLWTGAVGTAGYGNFWRGPRQRKDFEAAHRFAWRDSFGEIPDGLCVLHRCDVKLCVNPDHLFLGTISDNNWDKVYKGRAPRGEEHAHAIVTAETVREIRRLRLRGWTQREIAAQFGLKRRHVGLIATGEIWGHV